MNTDQKLVEDIRDDLAQTVAAYGFDEGQRWASVYPPAMGINYTLPDGRTLAVEIWVREPMPQPE